jgi:uncharacterized protein
MLNETRRNFTVITKPTTRCNLSCSYCYVDPDEELMDMDYRTLQNFIFSLPDLVERGSKANILWHGGEPLLMKKDFYKTALKMEDEVQKRTGIIIENSMQSNATLVDWEMAKFLHYNNINVGTSLDGPEHIHNRTRKYANGRGSFKEVARGLDNLIRVGANPGAICVLNKNNKDSIPEIYRFYKAINIDLKLNPLINSKRVHDNSKILGITPTDYLAATEQLFKLWYNDPKPTIRVNLGNEVIEPILTERSGLCCYDQVSCQESFFSVDPNGDVYPCGRFGEKDQFLYGNINKDSMQAILGSEKRKPFLERKEKLDGCKSCSEVKICNGGCPHNAFMEYGTIDAKDPYCTSRIGIVSYVRDIIMKDLEKARVN